MARRRAAQSAESRAEILHAAVEVIAQRGCAGATIGRIAEHAGLSTAAIFWHFTDKAGLLEAVALDIRETWIARVKMEALERATGRARLERIVEKHAEWVASEDTQLRAFILLGLEAGGMEQPAVGTLVAEMLRTWEAFLAGQVRLGQADGSISPRVDPARAAGVLVDAMLGGIVGRTARATRGAAPPAGWAGALINGVLRRKGSE